MVVQSLDVGKPTFTHVAVRVVVIVLLSQEPIGLGVTFVANIQEGRLDRSIIKQVLGGIKVLSRSSNCEPPILCTEVIK